MTNLFDEEDRTQYINLTPHEQNDQESPFIVEINIKSEEDIKKFADLTGYHTIMRPGLWSIKSYWYPPLEKGERGENYNYIWVEEDD